MMIIQAILYCALFLLCYMTATFILATLKKNNGIVDIGWGIGFIIIAWFTFFFGNATGIRPLLITALTTIWGARLSGYLFIRNYNKTEDPRYAAMRERWGSRALLYSFVFIYMLQGLLILLISYPIILVNTLSESSLSLLDIAGAILWACGFTIESISDTQLYFFTQKQENRGVILTAGLWNYSRHPNYFGEALLWWGIWLISLAVPYGFTAIISPLIVTILLLFVSGVPMAEKQIEHLQGYEEYKQSTSYFIPWFKKESIRR